MKVKRRIKGIFSSVLFSILIFSNLAHAQASGFQVKIDQITNLDFPQVEITLSVLNSQKLPITGLSNQNILLKEDGNQVDSFEFSTITNDDTPLALVILLDTSGSMKATNAQDPLGDAVASAAKLINRLNPGDHVAVITFADSVNVLQDLTTDKSALAAKLEGLNAEGATAMNDAVVAALNLLGNRSERRAIILITDGRPEGDQAYSFENALNLAAARLIPIYPVGFGDVDKTQLAKLAELSGGIEQIQPGSQGLEDAFNSILALFREQYVLKYESPSPVDNGMHQVEVVVRYQGESQSDTGSFQARLPIVLALRSPQAGSAVTDTADLEFEVDALNPVERVEVFIDGQLAQTFSGPPYVYTWESGGETPGNHAIRISAQDAAGNSEEATFDLIVEIKKQMGLIWLLGLGGLALVVIAVPLLLRSFKKGGPGTVQKGVLFETDGLNPGHEWPLNKNLMRLGRKLADNDIRLKGMDASRNHAVIERSRRGFCIRSQKPENPVLVNGEKVDERILQNGDLIQMGESIFRFENRR